MHVMVPLADCTHLSMAQAVLLACPGLMVRCVKRFGSNNQIQRRMQALSHPPWSQVVPLWEPWPLLPWHGAAMVATRGSWPQLHLCSATLLRSICQV